MRITQEDQEVLKNISHSHTLKELFRLFNGVYTESQIYSHCRHSNLNIQKISAEEKSKIQPSNSRQSCVNQDFFKKWSKEMAYILGFWYADGCIYGGKMIDFTVQKKDKYILKLIAKEIDYQGQVQRCSNRSAYQLNFSCVEMYRDIVRLGGTERKSLAIDFPNIPEKYLSHFVRGYFDGDGCIMNLKNNRVNSAFTSGSKKFLVKLHKLLKQHAGITGGSFDNSCCSLKFGKKDTHLLGSFIYKNCGDLYLSRKKIKFQ